MKPSKNDRHGCEIVRDFLLGLAVFLTVFTLAMLDSGTSHSAPAFLPRARDVFSERSNHSGKGYNRYLDPSGA